MKGEVCPCGCGGIITTARKLYDSEKCRPRYIDQLIITGEIRPDGWAKCQLCSKPFPRYAQVKGTTTKKFCGRKCASTAQVYTAFRFQAPNLDRIQKKERREREDERKFTCFVKEGIPCQHYKDWLEFPDFYCDCKGYTPDPKHGIKYDNRQAINPGITTVLGNQR